MKIFSNIVCIISLAAFLNKPANAKAKLDIETFVVFTGYNDVQIPGDNGTRFCLKNDLKPDAGFFYRLRFSYTIKSRHTISALYGPLETHSDGRIAKDVFFEGAIFNANTQVNNTYKFNSYRLTYRYDIVKKPAIEFGLGFTAKIRDATIALSSAGLTSQKDNVGFVPIVNFPLLWNGK